LSDGSSTGNTPEGHVKTLEPRPKPGSKQARSRARRSPQIGVGGLGGGALPVPGQQRTEREGFQTPGEEFWGSPTLQGTTTATECGSHSSMIVVSSDSEGSPGKLTVEADKGVAAELFGSPTVATEVSGSPSTQGTAETAAWVRCSASLRVAGWDLGFEHTGG
jgi:hypothetical protein